MQRSTARTAEPSRQVSGHKRSLAHVGTVCTCVCTRSFTWGYALPGVDQFIGRRVLELATGYATGSALSQPQLDHTFVTNSRCNAKVFAWYPG